MEAIGHIFERACAASGGQVVSAEPARSGLLLRARWQSAAARIRQGDMVHCGIAAHIGTELSYYLYSERLVCTNGAVRRHAKLARSLPVPETEAEFLESLMPAIAWASAGTAAQQHAQDLAQSMSIEMTPELNGWVAEQLMLMGGQQETEAIAARVEAAFAEEDQRIIAAYIEARRQYVRAAAMRQQHRTLFDAVQAVTAAARDTEDPVLKWSLERLGGDLLDYGLAAGPAPAPHSGSGYGEPWTALEEESAARLFAARVAGAVQPRQQSRAASAAASDSRFLRLPTEPVR
ncbi:MAG: hypothetical protein NW241_06025 [Bacteroidia bacterium]|nr:hypothetical protein [Bacteroidia bacterium]